MTGREPLSWPAGSYGDTDDWYPPEFDGGNDWFWPESACCAANSPLGWCACADDCRCDCEDCGCEFGPGDRDGEVES